jgi:uncharacterized membrane protein
MRSFRASTPTILLGLCLIVLGGHFFRLATRTGLWIDELYTWHTVQLPWVDMVLNRLRRGHSLLYFLMEKSAWQASLALDIPVELRLRLVSLLCWIAAVGVFALSIRRVLSPVGALAATGVFGFSNIAAVQAVNARMYSLALLLAVIHFFAYLRIEQNGKAAGRAPWLAYFFSTILGVSTTPGFALLAVSTLLSFAVRIRSRAQKTALAAASLCISALFYAPALYFYMQTPVQIGPVANPALGILYTAPALLTAIGRGVVPSSGIWPRIAFALSVALAAWILLTLIRHWGRLPDSVRRALIVFTVPYAIVFAGMVLSHVTGLTALYAGTDRYLIGLVPVGAFLAGSAFETIHDRHYAYALLAAVIGVSAGSLASSDTGDGRIFRSELERLCTRTEIAAPAVVSAPEVVDGARLYCPRLNVMGTVGINSRSPDTIASLMDKAAQAGHLLVVYYSGNVPELLGAANETFETSAVLSRRIYGRKSNPIFAIYYFASPRQR